MSKNTERIRTICILLVLGTGTAYAQSSGTIKVEKAVEEVSVIQDTIKILYGNEEFFKVKKVKYKPSPGMAAVKMKNLFWRKSIPAGYYVVTYPKTGTLHSRGQINNGKMDGEWTFQTIDASRVTIREFDEGELVGKAKSINVE